MVAVPSIERFTSAADESASRRRLGGSVPAESNRRRQIVFRKSKKKLCQLFRRIVMGVSLSQRQDLAGGCSGGASACTFSPGGERPVSGDPINGTGRSMCCTGSKVVKETGKRKNLDAILMLFRRRQKSLRHQANLLADEGGCRVAIGVSLFPFAVRQLVPLRPLISGGAQRDHRNPHGGECTRTPESIGPAAASLSIFPLPGTCLTSFDIGRLTRARANIKSVRLPSGQMADKYSSMAKPIMAKVLLQRWPLLRHRVIRNAPADGIHARLTIQRPQKCFTPIDQKRT